MKRIYLLTLFTIALFGSSSAQWSHVESELHGVNCNYLDRVQGVTISPDNKHIYAVSEYDGLSVWNLNLSTAMMTFVEEFGPADGLDYPFRLTISNDGKHVYVPEGYDYEVSVWTRNAVTGTLNNTSTITGLSGRPHTIVMHPNDNFVYVGTDNGTTYVYSRNTASGVLTLSNTYSSGVAPGIPVCGSPYTRYTKRIKVVGNHLYTCGNGTDNQSVDVFDITGGGSGLSWKQSLRSSGANCSGGLPAVNPWDMEVTPNGQHVYVAGGSGNNLLRFSRNTTTGMLTYINQYGLGGWAYNVKATPDGSQLFAETGGTMYVMDIAGNGALSVAETHSAVSGLNSFRDYAFTSDSRVMVGASRNGDALISFYTGPNVDLLAFKGTLDANNYASLKWSVANTNSIETFDIERSDDGKTYYHVGDVNALTGQMTYTFDDPEVINGTSYYRLKMKDIDNAISHSKSIVLKSGVEDAFEIEQLFPNPATSTVSYSVYSHELNTINLRILNSLGQVIYKEVGNTNSNNNIDLNNFSKGIYHMQFSSDTHTKVKRLVIQ